MITWKVKTPTGNVDVKAPITELTTNGILLFKHQSGELIYAFAPGAWLECENPNKAMKNYSRD
jgi:hypothetical protein